MTENAITTESFLDRLRITTSQSHKDLENLPVSLSIVDPAVTAAQYSHYLSLMHDVVKDAEQNVFAVLHTIIEDLQERNKAHLLESDLRALNIEKTVHTKPLSSKLQNTSAAYAMGIMYVIEGSSLGGRFILKNITESLGFDANNGAGYFAGYGNATGSKWKHFLNALMKYEEDNNNAEEIIAGAKFAFNEIAAHFTANTLQ